MEKLIKQKNQTEAKPKTKWTKTDVIILIITIILFGLGCVLIVAGVMFMDKGYYDLEEAKSAKWISIFDIVAGSLYLLPLIAQLFRKRHSPRLSAILGCFIMPLASTIVGCITYPRYADAAYKWVALAPLICGAIPWGSFAIFFFGGMFFGKKKNKKA